MIDRMIETLPVNAAHRVLLAQVVRYAVAGGFVTLLGVAAYALWVRVLLAPPLLANIVAYIVSMAVGYFVHARFSFRGHGLRDNPVAQGGKFFLCLFVWLFTSVMHWDRLSPIIAMVFITPAICFVIYRKWVFR